VPAGAVLEVRQVGAVARHEGNGVFLLGLPASWSKEQEGAGMRIKKEVSISLRLPKRLFEDLLEAAEKAEEGVSEFVRQAVADRVWGTRKKENE